MGSQEQRFYGPHWEQQPPGLRSEVPHELPYTTLQNMQEAMEVDEAGVGGGDRWGTWL